ncbi:MAG: hypothetical protein M5R41_15055 [Bacteroidia bacterium]|nr:hypothetical protein [Bacteroidia bacterium]
MNGRIVIVLLFQTFLCGVVTAQETPDSLVSTAGLSLLTPEHRLLLAYPSELKILAFRSYDISREMEIAEQSEFAAMDLPVPDHSESSGIETRGHQRAHLTLPLNPRGDQLTLEGAGRFVLLQALRLGYQFFRESTRRGSLTEFDYLELPQGTGMLRTFEEVQREAQLRGEMQSLRTHEDKREREKNKVPKEE